MQCASVDDLARHNVRIFIRGLTALAKGWDEVEDKRNPWPNLGICRAGSHNSHPSFVQESWLYLSFVW